MDEQKLNDELARAEIPQYMHHGIQDYVLHHYPVGGFLKAVFSNDLHAAADRADSTNAAALPAYAQLLHWLPSNCWGSREIVDAWTSQVEESA